VIVIAEGFAEKVFARFRPEKTPTNWSESEIDECLDKNRADLLLSATSWKSALEQGFRNRAHLRGIPSVVVIDFWSNYPLRWQHATYQFEDGIDRVCVMDEQTAKAMNQAGYPITQLSVTGQPHLERCFQRAIRQRPPHRPNPGVAVLFLTISLAALGLNDDPVDQIRIICEALGRWSATTRQSVSLTIRLHPHETAEPNLINRIRAFAPPGVAVELDDRARPIFGQLKRSDLVLGYITMGLFEARSLGKQAIAIKLADHPPELVAAMAGAGIPLLPLNSDCIASFLCHPGRQELNHTGSTHHGATEVIAKICCQLARKAEKN
jgi:hypothetical protein